MPGTPPFRKPPARKPRRGQDGRAESPAVAGTVGPRKPWLPGRNPPRRPALAHVGRDRSAPVIPAAARSRHSRESGNPLVFDLPGSSIFQGRLWIPAFAGMTGEGAFAGMAGMGRPREWRKRAAAVPHPRLPDPRRSVPLARGSLAGGACFDHALARGYAVPVRMRTSP